MKLVTVSHGARSTTLEVEDDTTFGDLINNDELRTFLRTSDNLNAILNGVVMDEELDVPAGAEVRLATKLMTKGLAFVARICRLIAG